MRYWKKVANHRFKQYYRTLTWMKVKAKTKLKLSEGTSREKLQWVPSLNEDLYYKILLVRISIMKQIHSAWIVIRTRSRSPRNLPNKIEHSLKKTQTKDATSSSQSGTYRSPFLSHYCWKDVFVIPLYFNNIRNNLFQ